MGKVIQYRRPADVFNIPLDKDVLQLVPHGRVRVDFGSVLETGRFSKSLGDSFQ